MNLMDDVDWITLSHCDGHNVKDLVEYNNRPAETVVNRIKSTVVMKNYLKIIREKFSKYSQEK